MAGVASEGLYRVAGFHDDVEAIKMAFDKGDYSLSLLSVVYYLNSRPPVRANPSVPTAPPFSCLWHSACLCASHDCWHADLIS